jgi:hypothetical protein
VVFHYLESPMSKRKQTKGSKQARSKVAAKAQRQSVVRSPKPSHVRSIATGSNELRPKPHENATPEAPVEMAALPVAALPVMENPAIASQDHIQRTTRGDDLTKALNVFTATANVWVYQRKLTEIAQANMLLAFEFTQRLAQIKSPFELPSVLSELTRKQSAMFQNLVFPNQSSQ